MIEEILAVFHKNFKTTEQTFQYFLHTSKRENIFFDDFKKGLDALFPERFYESDVRTLFSKIKGDDNEYITFEQFVTAFDSSKKSLLLKPQRPKSSFPPFILISDQQSCLE